MRCKSIKPRASYGARGLALLLDNWGVYNVISTNDYLEDAIGFKTLKGARDEYEDIAAELLSPSIEGVVEYPDYVLSYEDRNFRCFSLDNWINQNDNFILSQFLYSHP
jgi:hypothetical protein